jgi:hypothetical protein
VPNVEVGIMYSIIAKHLQTLPCLYPRIAFRDIVNRENKRTFTAALIPPKTFLVNNAPYWLLPAAQQVDEAYLLGVLCSLPLDWYARRFIERHANFFLVNPFPVPRPTIDSKLRKRVIELAGRMAAKDMRFKDWAKAVGVECGLLKDDENQDMIHELDAVVAHLYGLSEKQLIHIFETFHEGWDHAPRLKETLRHFKAATKLKL